MKNWTVMYWSVVNGKKELVVNKTPDTYGEAKKLAEEVEDAIIIEDYKGEIKC